ncbi:hypothetical protein EPN15_02905 [Patescibacteria group bacterium]|nr:MAG: hypothetical protein EPN15_02905 [Patescibacteria group bacterium]
MDRLLKNKNAARCSEKSISYAKKFKLAAVKRYNEDGLPASEVFREAGFDLHLIGKDTPKDCLRCWRRAYAAKGEGELLIETRGRGKGGGRPKTKNITEAEKIERLAAEVAYLKAENDFLAKLRAKRTE